MKKKILSIVLCMALVLTAFSGVFAVSAEETAVTFPEYFTVTNDLSGRNGNTNNYCNYAEYGYVSRTPSILNPDGYSYKYTTSSTKGSEYPYVDAWGNFSNDIYAEAVSTAKAVVAVISADINNTATAYPQNYEFTGIAQNGLTSVTTAYHLKNDGSVKIYENYIADDYSDTMIGLNSGETAIFISTIPEGTDITAINDCRANFHSKYSAKGAAYNGNVYYIDSVGLVSDVDAFVAAIPSIAKPTAVAAWNVKGDAGARWTLDTLYADMGVANYHVNIFDSKGAFVKSVTTDKTEITFAAVAGATYTVWVAGYDVSGNRVTTPVMAKTTVKTANYTTSASPGYSGQGGGFTKTAGSVIRTTNEHNPDGKSHQFTLSGGTGYGWFNVQSGYYATLTTGALVWVVSADEKNASNYPFKINSTGTPSQGGMEFDVVSIAADGTVTTQLGIKRTTFPAGSTNYVILRNTNGQYWAWEKSTWNPMLCLWSDDLASRYSSVESPLIYYSDSIGYTEDPDALINRLTTTESTEQAYFTVTNNLNNSGLKSNGYPVGEYVTGRTATAHNTDGASYKFGPVANSGSDWPQAHFNYSYDGVADAIVAVVSCGKNEVSETKNYTYPLKITTNLTVSERTTVTVKADGSIVSSTGAASAYLWATAGETYYLIYPITDKTAKDSYIGFWSDNSAKLFDAEFYVDAIGFASNRDNLVTALTTGKPIDLTFEETELTIPEGNDIALSGNVVSGLIIDKSYSVSDPHIIAVDGETLTAVGGGTAYASLTVDGYTDFANCKINVIPVEVGDVNYDGESNVLDLIRIKKYLAETTDDISKKGADCSLNGAVDTDDIVSIRQLLLGVQKKNQ